MKTNYLEGNGAYIGGATVGVLALVGLLQMPPLAFSSVLAGRMQGIHLVLELFAVIIAMLIVMVCWHTFDASDDRPSNVLVSGFLIVAICDFAHALSYGDMPLVFGEPTASRTIFFWLMGRTFEVATLALVAVTGAPWMGRFKSMGLGLTVSGGVVWFGSVHLDSFPATFVEGVGVTPFKAGYEYVLFALNLLVAEMLRRKSQHPGQEQYRLLALSSFLMGIGELAFTSYLKLSDFQNLFGHVFKVVAYTLLYRATFITSIRAPFEALSKSEASVRESDLKLRTLSDNLPQCMVYQFAVNSDGSKQFTYVSEGVQRLHGLMAEDVLRDPHLVLSQIHPEDRLLLLAAESRSLETFQVFHVNVRLQRADGAARHMQFTSTPRRIEGGTVVWDGIEVDVTDAHEAEDARRLLETQLRESQKMESLGTLSSGIAHDFNNILGSILGNVDLAADDASRGDVENLKGSHTQIRKAALRARDLVGQILTFSRREPPVRIVQPLAPVIEEVIGLLRATLPGNVSLHERLSSRRIEVLADTTQIEQVVLNLCTNAWQAMGEDGGVIEVGVNVVDVGAADAAIADIAPGAYARLRVKDNGCGMDAVTCSRVYEPFFTTKPVGHGTGLGLAVTHGIVLTHGGTIRIRSTPGQGTTFDVYLPLVSVTGSVTDVGPATVAFPADFASDGQGEKILYVDDDEVMSLMAERLLTRAGYTVTCFSDPAEAVSAFRSNPGHYACAVTDFNMPLYSGLDVVRMLREIVPALPVVLTSGSVTDALRARAGELQVPYVLEKQNTLEELPVTIRMALDNQGVAGDVVRQSPLDFGSTIEHRGDAV